MGYYETRSQDLESRIKSNQLKLSELEASMHEQIRNMRKTFSDCNKKRHEIKAELEVMTEELSNLTTSQNILTERIKTPQLADALYDILYREGVLESFVGSYMDISDLGTPVEGSTTKETKQVKTIELHDAADFSGILSMSQKRGSQWKVIGYETEDCIVDFNVTDSIELLQMYISILRLNPMFESDIPALYRLLIAGNVATKYGCYDWALHDKTKNEYTKSREEVKLESMIIVVAEDGAYELLTGRPYYSTKYLKQAFGHLDMCYFDGVKIRLKPSKTISKKGGK